MDSVKRYFRTYLWRDTATKIITVNTLVWLVLSICWLFSPDLEGEVLSLVALPSSLHLLALHPWSILTYMVVQTDFMHLLVNMLCLMPFARLMSDLQGGIRTVTLYIYGGVVAAVVFIALQAVGIGTYSWLIGASCSVLAIIGAVAVMFPHFQMGLLLFGPVKIIWVAVAVVILFAIGWPDMPTAIAHLAGLLTGITYGLAKNRGVDITAPALRISDFISQKRVYEAKPNALSGHRRTADDDREMDRLLDKVKRSGYSSLSSSERQRLFDLSRKS